MKFRQRYLADKLKSLKTIQEVTHKIHIDRLNEKFQIEKTLKMEAERTEKLYKINEMNQELKESEVKS